MKPIEPLRFGNFVDILLAKVGEIKALQEKINALLKQIDVDEPLENDPLEKEIFAEIDILEEEMKKIELEMDALRQEEVYVWRKNRGFKNP